MKKWLICLLILTLVFSVLTVSASADSGVTVSVTLQSGEKDIVLSKADLETGKEIAVKFSVSGAAGLKALQFKVVVDGLVQGSPTGPKAEKYEPSNGMFAIEDPNGLDVTDLFTLTLKATNAAASITKSYKIEVTDVKYTFSGSDELSGTGGSLDGITVKHADDAHTWTDGEVTQQPTCQATGTQEQSCACGKTDTVTLSKLEHKWAAAPTWSWGTDNKTATATLQCNSNSPHTEEQTATVTVSNTDATCTKAGTTTYTASANFSNGQTFTDEKKVEGQALGHVWGEPTYTWDGDTVTATRHCTREGDEATTITATAKGVKKETPATCTKDGSSYYEATVKFTEDGKSYTVESTPVTIPATGHKWADATFTWNDENTNVTKVIATCSNGNCPDEGSVDLTASTTVTNETTKKATCTDDGTVTYTATAKATNPAKDFTDTKNVTVSKLGHDWTGDAVITWKDDSDPAKGATVTLKCKKDPTHTLTKDATVASAVKQPASCTKDEITTYTVTADFKTESNKDQPENTKPSTNVFSATKDAKTKDKLGHKWPEPKDVKFTWTDTDPTAPTAALSVSCQNKGCDTHYDTPQELTVSVAKTDSTDPKCAEDGSATWSATAKTPDGKVTYSEDGHKTVLSKLGHDWGEPVFNWTEKDGKWDATEASRTCKRDAEHTDKANATVKAETTDATYTAAGKTVYTATAEFDGKVITDTKETTIPKLTASVKTNVPAANAGSGAEAALQSSTDALVDAVLSGTKPAGMPDNVYEALQDAAESDQSGLTVSTELVVSPTDTPSTIPGAVSAIDASIKITINNTDIEEYVPVSGNLTEVSEPITLKVPKPTSGGPIFWVVGIHNGNQSKLACTFSGNDILFSTAQFSTFVVVGSNDISNANVTGVDPSYAYTGAVIRPAVKVTINGDNETLTEGTDYTVEYKDNTNVGTATVTITGIGKYTGTVTKTFAITEKPVTATATPTPTATAAPSATSAAGAPATGDETPVALYAGMLVLSAAGLALVLRKRRPTDT